MSVSLKQLRGDGERCVASARAAAKETTIFGVGTVEKNLLQLSWDQIHLSGPQWNSLEELARTLGSSEENQDHSTTSDWQQV